MTKEDLIEEYVSAHAECRWMDACDLDDLLHEFSERLLKLEQPSLHEGLWSKDDDNCLHDIKHYISEINDIATSEEVKTRVGTLLLWLDLLRIRIVARNGATKLHEGLEEAAIDAAQLDMQDRQIMEDSNEHRMLYSRIFRRGLKAGAKWRDAQIPKLPDNLEKAAMASMPKPNGIESNIDFSFFQMVWMFEKGAEWMAGQGVSGIGSLHYANQGEGVKDELELFFHDIFPDDEWEEGELVIVQVRKKED